MDNTKLRFRIYLLLLVAVMLIGSLGFMKLEGLSLLDAIYMNVVTISTVGYGDIQPHGTISKLLVIFVIVMGVGSFIGVISNATELMIHRSEKKRQQEKINVVIGVFFSEVGTELLTYFCALDFNIDEVRSSLILKDGWDDINFSHIHGEISNHNFQFDVQGEDLAGIKEFLTCKRSFLVRLLEHPSISEHGRFTELLREVFHVTEELSSRVDVLSLPATDLAHISNDIRNAYVPLVHQWLDYMLYLKKNYPNLFSFASRMNPFVKNSSPIIN